MWKSLLLRSETRLRCPLSVFPCNIELAVLASATRQEKQVKCIKIEKEETKLIIYR